MKKVILIEPVLAHYRKDVFNSFYNSRDFDFEVVAGRNYQGVNSLKRNEGSLFDHASFRLFNHTFYYLKGSIRYILSKKPSVIICTGVDFHLLHTIIIYFIYRIFLRRTFYWYSHATLGHQGRMGFLLRKFFYKTSSGIFAYSKEGRHNLHLMGIRDKKIKVVNNSINREDYGYLNYDIYNKKVQNVFTVLYCGRVTKAKKVDLLIRALDILNQRKVFDYKCYIVGDGNLDQLKKMAETLNVSDKVDFAGAKYGKEVHPYFLHADLFVYPGGIGLSVLHALSFGLPVITTDNTSLHFPEFELLLPGFNGDLYMDNSVEDLAEKIIDWRNKIHNSGEIYRKNCVLRIEELGYLPDVLSDNVLSFLKSGH